MRKLLIMAGLLFLSVPLMAVENSNTMKPAVSEWSNDGIQIYIVGGSTTATATVQVNVDSITFTTTDGLYPGTTDYVFTSATETLSDLQTALMAISTATAGAEGGIIVTIPTSTYELNCSSDLAEVSPTGCLGVANKVTLDLDTVYGWSYTTPAGCPRGYQRHITGLSVNATFGSGTVYLYVRDGTDTTDTTLLKYEIDTSATQTNIILPSNGDFAGSKETQLRFDIIGSAAITAGFMNIIGHKE